MLRMYPCRSAAAAQSYFTQGLAREDYYTQGQEIVGRWGGGGIDRLGMAELAYRDGVTRQAFAALTENRHPVTGEQLTARTRADRTIGYDLNFHAPKGVSLLHAVHGDSRIMEAFREAVHQTMLDIEFDAATRVRRNGADEDRPTRNLVWSEFVHLTARPTDASGGPDPHLHAHCFVMNATFDGEEDRWKAAQFRQIVRDAPYYEAAFHTRFAGALNDIGYQVERTATGWDLAGVPRLLVDKFSTRTREIEAAAAELGITDPVAKGQLGARTRKGKDKDRTVDDLRSSYTERLNDQERDLLSRLDEHGRGGGAAPPIDPADDPSGGPSRGPSTAELLSAEKAIGHCFERRSSMPMRRLAAEAMKRGVGEVTVDGIWKALDAKDLLTKETRGQLMATTKDVLAEERAILEFAREGRATCRPVRERYQIRQGSEWTLKDERLSKDQRRAVDHVLDSSDRVVAIRGAAGVGKTTMMAEAIDAIRKGGQPVMVVAPTARAARGPDSLRTKGFPGADTVANLLDKKQMQKGLNGPRGGVLWVDEAGLLGAGTMARLFEVAGEQNARVILSGDERQHKPVERGDALRVLQRLGGIETVELTSIRRQRGLYRDAVAALSEQDLEKGITRLEELDAFKEIPDAAERSKAVAAEYMETRRSGKSCVVVSPTHAEGGRIAGEIRAMQREAGRIRGEDREVLRLRDLGWSEEERRDPARYEEGLIVHFHQGAKGAVAGDKCEIVGRREREDGSFAVRAKTPRGKEIDLPIESADRFQVYKQESMKLAVGDEVRITKNGRTVEGDSKFTNGTVQRVVGFTEQGGILVKGLRRNSPTRMMPTRFGHLAYGSVMTSHAAQGSDADHVILAQSAMSAAASTAEQFYVSASRGKNSISVFTDDVAQLTDAVRKLAVRESGHELTQGVPMETKLPKLAKFGQEIARRDAQQRQSPPGTSRTRPGPSSPKPKPPTRRPPGPGREFPRDR